MKSSCSLCSSGMRAHCPALNAPICGPCCGSKRNVSIKCTADCRYNPFSPLNYDGWLRIDSGLSRKMLDYIARFYNEDEFRKTMQEMMYDGDSQHAYAMGSAAAVYYFFFYKRLKNGKTLSVAWEEEGWQGLNVDERMMMEYRKNAAPAIVEVQKIIDDQSMECRDLLRPQRGIFMMIDRGVTKNITRFSYLWMWVANYPYFSRPASEPLGIPENVIHLLMKKIYMDIQKKTGKESDTFPDDTVVKDFGRYARFICDESLKSRQRMLNRMDFHECKAFYEIKGSREDVKNILDSKPEFQFDGDAKPDEWSAPGLSYGWLRKGESKAIEKMMSPSFQYSDDDEMVGTLGHIFLGEKEFIFRTMSRVKFEFAKEMVEKYWRSLLKFKREAVIDIAKVMAQRTTDVVSEAYSVSDHKEVIPKDIEEKLMTESYRRYYEKFLNDSIPALDGMTPRKAAKLAKMRPRLIELMKGHVHSIDSINKDRGFSISIDWVLDELGLNELK